MTQAISDPKQASAALAELFDTHNHVVFFGGAGVSTASGIPDFRSVDGLYNQKYDYPPETILSHTFFMKTVPSGRRVTLRPPRSANVYISLETTSVDSPTPRANSAVSSKIGNSMSP